LAKIIEEVPGVKPNWFVCGEPELKYPFPAFDNCKEAIEFCEGKGYAYTVSYFEP
jgi:hypothetical protein